MPLPEFLARRADLYELRAATGDAALAADDRATVLAIAQLTGEAAGVYDRTLSLYLADTGIDAERRSALAEAEIAGSQGRLRLRCARLGLLANGPPARSRCGDDRGARVRHPRREAALPRRHDQAAAAVRRRRATGPASLLEDALALDPSFDPVRRRAPARPWQRLPMTPASLGRRRRSRRRGLVLALVVPAVALAHPLGNFTINHYAGIRVEPDRSLLDVVIDQAEIPTFQARLGFDTDGDGEVSDDGDRCRPRRRLRLARAGARR